MDGDGEADDLSLRRVGDEVIARAELATGDCREVTLAGADDPAIVEIVGVEDVDLDGKDEAFVLTHTGASTEFLELLAFEGDLVRVLNDDGDVLQLGVGGSVGHAAGASCVLNGEPRLRIVGAAPVGPSEQRYRWERATYRWEGDRISFVSATHGTVDAEDVDALAPFYRLRCGSVSR